MAWSQQVSGVTFCFLSHKKPHLNVSPYSGLSSLMDLTLFYEFARSIMNYLYENETKLKR